MGGHFIKIGTCPCISEILLLPVLSRSWTFINMQMLNGVDEVVLTLVVVVVAVPVV